MHKSIIFNVFDNWHLKPDCSLCLRENLMETPTQWTSTQRSLSACLRKWNTRYSKTWKSLPKDVGPCTTNPQRYCSLSFTHMYSPISCSSTQTPPHFLFRLQETSPSTSWPACCRGTIWISVCRVWRRRWTSGAPAAFHSNTNRTGSSRVTAWSPIDWFQRTMPTISLLKVRAATVWWCVYSKDHNRFSKCQLPVGRFLERIKEERIVTVHNCIITVTLWYKKH